MNNMPQNQFCQSCAMPMIKTEDFGTNADGSTSQDYCVHCFQNGKFTAPDITMERMIGISTGMMKTMHLPERAIEQTRQLIPTLKRWH